MVLIKRHGVEKGVEGNAKRIRVIDIKRKGMGCERCGEGLTGVGGVGGQ